MAGPLDQLRVGPMTPTSAAQSSPNLGAQANAAQVIKQCVLMLETVLPQIEIGSELHQAVRTAVNSLSKHVPKMAEAAGLQQSAVRDLMLRAQQMGPMIAAMQTRAGGPGPSGTTPPAQ